MQCIDEESWTCYVLFVLIFVLDVSLLSMVFPVSLAAYALLTQRPRALYWQVSDLDPAAFQAVHHDVSKQAILCAVPYC